VALIPRGVWRRGAATRTEAGCGAFTWEWGGGRAGCCGLSDKISGGAGNRSGPQPLVGKAAFGGPRGSSQPQDAGPALTTRQLRAMERSCGCWSTAVNRPERRGPKANRRRAAADRRLRSLIPRGHILSVQGLNADSHVSADETADSFRIWRALGIKPRLYLLAYFRGPGRGSTHGYERGSGPTTFLQPGRFGDVRGARLISSLFVAALRLGVPAFGSQFLDIVPIPSFGSWGGRQRIW